VISPEAGRPFWGSWAGGKRNISLGRRFYGPLAIGHCQWTPTGL
jgi:hypothetical protein